MKYGICGEFGMAASAKQAGYDYLEVNVCAVLRPREGETEFAVSLAQLKGCGLPCTAANGFLPGDLKVTGPEVDGAALELYVTTAMARAERAGIRTIVFGSGDARRVPEGFDHARATAQLVDFLGMAGPLAKKRGVTVVIEPLCRKECNIFNTVGECARAARSVKHPAVKVLVDAYHWAVDAGSAQDLVESGDILAHVHIATATRRVAPGVEPCDFGPFFAALARARYDGSISIEGGIPQPASDLPRALAIMKALAKRKA
jgi:sugar phosphate isomerase/epimerase